MSKLLDFDPLGTNPDNLVVDSPYLLTLGGENVILPKEGYIYWDSVQLTIVRTGEVILSTDSRLRQYNFNTKLTKLTGKEIVEGVIITDTQIYGDMLLTVRCIGNGHGGNEARLALEKAIASAKLSSLSWHLVEHPDTFLPVRHMHSFTTVDDLDKLSNWVSGLSKDIIDYERTKRSGNSVDAKINRLKYLVSKVRSTVNEVERRFDNGLTSEDLSQVRNTLEDTMETIVFNAEVIVDNSIRLSDLEGGFTDFVVYLSDKFGDMADTIDVLPGSDYLIPEPAVVPPSPAIPNTNFGLLSTTADVLASLTGGSPATIVSVDPYGYTLADTTGNAVGAMGVNIEGLTVKTYFELEVILPEGTGDMRVSLGFGASEEMALGMAPGEAVYIAMFRKASQGLADLSVYKDPSVEYASSDKVNTFIIRAGVTYDPLTRLISYIGDVSGVHTFNIDPTISTVASSEEGVIPVLTAILGAFAPGNVTCTIHRDTANFIGPVPSGYIALGETTHEIRGFEAL